VMQPEKRLEQPDGLLPQHQLKQQRSCKWQGLQTNSHHNHRETRPNSHHKEQRSSSNSRPNSQLPKVNSRASNASKAHNRGKELRPTWWLRTN